MNKREFLKTSFALSKELKSLLMISEIRIVEADNLWMSTCYKQSCVVIHFTWH